MEIFGQVRTSTGRYDNKITALLHVAVISVSVRGLLSGITAYIIMLFSHHELIGSCVSNILHTNYNDVLENFE